MPAFLQKIKFSSLHPNFIGALWMLGSVFFYLSSYAILKFAGETLPSIQLVFIRSIFQMLVVLPVIIHIGFGTMKSKNIFNYACRLIFGVTNIVLSFYAFTKLDFAISTSLVYTRPLFTIVLAALFLRENVGWKRGLATLVGFIGILIVLDPGAMGLSLAEIAALLSAFFIAVTYIFIQKLSQTENHFAMLMWFGIGCTVTTLYPALLVWQPVSIKMYFIIFIIAGSATAAQYCIIRAYQVGRSTIISPLEYLQIPLSVVIGLIFFSEKPTIHFAVGSCLIILTNLYILHKRAGD